MIPGCLHGNVESHQVAYDRCADCGERVPNVLFLTDRRVATEFVREGRFSAWRLA